MPLTDLEDNMSHIQNNEGKKLIICILFTHSLKSFIINISEGKPTMMMRLCLKTSKAAGRGCFGITSSSEQVYKLML